MNYSNKNERSKIRRQFILMFSLAVILSVAVASAFFIPGNSAKKQVNSTNVVDTTGNNTSKIITKEVIVVDTINQKKAAALQQMLDDKNEQVLRLEKQIISLKRQKSQSRVAPAGTFGEVEFLKLALRSQTAQIDKLKKENQSLKQQRFK